MATTTTYQTSERRTLNVLLAMICFPLVSMSILALILASPSRVWNCARCPIRCSCYLDRDTRQRVVDCHSRDLLAFPEPETIPADVDVISLHNNSITSVPSSYKFWLPKVVELDLSMNQLTEFPNLRGFYHLRYLDLSWNNLSGEFRLLESASKSLTSETLEHLMLANNAIQRIVITGAPSNHLLSRLRTLILRDNQLSSIEIDALNPSVSLANLDLSCNQLNQVPYRSLRSLARTLVKLDLSSNPIKSLNRGDFLALSQLQQIDLSHMSLRLVEERAFMDLPYLQHIRFNDNEALKEIQPGALVNVPKLVEIELQQCALTSLANFSSLLGQLDILRLNGNPLRCDCSLRLLTEKLQSDVFEVSDDGQRSISCIDDRNSTEARVQSMRLASDSDPDDEGCAPIIVSLPAQVVGVEGEPVTIECDTLGWPLPHIAWLNRDDHNTVLGHGRRLVLDNLSWSKVDSNVLHLSCLANSSYGTAVAHTRVLTVSRPPIIDRRIDNDLPPLKFMAPPSVPDIDESLWMMRRNLTSQLIKNRKTGHLFLLYMTLVLLYITLIYILMNAFDG